MQHLRPRGLPCSATCLQREEGRLQILVFFLLGNLPGTLMGLFRPPSSGCSLFPVSLGFCPPPPYREPEPSVAEPPSCPLALDMSLRDSSYSVAPGPCVVAQLPPEDVNHLTDSQSRDQGFLRTKMKVIIFILSQGPGACVEAMSNPQIRGTAMTQGTNPSRGL